VKLTAKYARQILRYDERTGLCYWKQKIHKRIPIGALAGSTHRKYGYVYITIRQIHYKAHGLIWFMKTGRWPRCDVDHINGKRSDNRWKNLRLATRSQNCANGRLRDHNTSGFKGVSWDARRKKWRSRIKVFYREKWLGYHTSRKAAHAAYIAGAQLHFGEFARAR
jgi:hypothetical protein